MESPFLLTIVGHEQSTALRERMDDAGCVFEFVLFRPAPEALVDETLHRQALQGMGCFLAASAENWLAAQAGNYLPEVYSPQADDDWRVDKAIATPLSQAQVRNLTLTEDYEHGPLALYASYTGAPYGVSFEGGEAGAQSTFHEWLELLGLEEHNDVVVINWVNGYALQWISNAEHALAGWESWSPWYFEDGLEWWGIWCLTIWNPRLNTLSVVVASTSD